MIKIIYRTPYGLCRSLGTFIITPPYNESLPTITSCSWDCNHFLVWIETMKYSTPYLREIQEQGIRLPAVLCQKRTDEGREKRRGGIEVFRYKFLTPRTDGICNTLTGVQKDNLIMTKNNKPTMEYHPNPTKEDLLEYFGQRIKIRKMTPTEALRLMDVDDSDIEKMKAAGIAKTNLYKLAGNSIVVSCLYHIFRTMFIPGQPENEGKTTVKQFTIFDYL